MKITPGNRWIGNYISRSDTSRLYPHALHATFGIVTILSDDYTPTIAFW